MRRKLDTTIGLAGDLKAGPRVASASKILNAEFDQ